MFVYPAHKQYWGISVFSLVLHLRDAPRTWHVQRLSVGQAECSMRFRKGKPIATLRTHLSRIGWECVAWWQPLVRVCISLFLSFPLKRSHSAFALIKSLLSIWHPLTLSSQMQLELQQRYIISHRTKILCMWRMWRVLMQAQHYLCGMIIGCVTRSRMARCFSVCQGYFIFAKVCPDNVMSPLVNQTVPG